MVTRTIPRLLRRTVEQVPDKTWLLASDGGRLTYAQALDRIERAAGSAARRRRRVRGPGPRHRRATPPTIC